MKKRLFSITLILILIISAVAGCKKKQVGTSEDNAIVEEEEVKKSFHFGFSCMDMDNPFYVTLEQSVRETVEFNGHTMISENPQMDTDLQIQQISEMIAEGIDAIFLCPISWDKITPALDELKEADVKIINIDSEVQDFDKIDAFVGSNNNEAGKLCGRDLIESRPDGGKIVLLEAALQNSVKERISGFEEEVAGEGFEVIARKDCNGEVSAAKETVAALLNEHNDITAIMCGNDPMALGAVEAIREAGRTDILVYGVDGSPELKQELLKENTPLKATCGQSPINMGKKAAQVAQMILENEKFDKKTYENVFLINAQNIDMYGADGWQ